jgi:hypothetical protein
LHQWSVHRHTNKDLCQSIKETTVIKKFEDNDAYREKHQKAYKQCCINTYGLVAEDLRPLGVTGDDNHDVIQGDIEPRIVDGDGKESIKQLRQAGVLLYDAPDARVPDRIGPQRFWSVEEQEVT